MDILIAILTSLVSGLVGVLVGTWLSYIHEVRREKISILKVLVTYRYYPSQGERVTALNMIPIAFRKDGEICALFEKYKKAQAAVADNISNSPVFGEKINALDDSYIKLVEAIAKNLHYKSLSWDKLKHPYYLRSYLDVNGQTQYF